MAIYNIILFGLFLTAICEILFCIESKRKRNIFSFWVVILILFKGLRWDTGTDWSQYYSVFNDADWNNIFSFWRYGIYSSYLEPGYVFINVIIKTFFPYYTFFLLITNIFILYAYTKIIWKYLPNYQLVALAILAVSTELFPVRQTLTFAILCLSFEYILNRDFKKYLLCCIVCFAIHRSSLLFVPLYWVLNFNFKLKQSIVIYICTIISINFMYKLFDLFNSSDLLISLTGGITQTYNATNENYQSEQDEYNFSSALISYINALVQLSFFAYTNNQLKKSLHLKRFVPPFFRHYFLSS